MAGFEHYHRPWLSSVSIHLPFVSKANRISRCHCQVSLAGLSLIKLVFIFTGILLLLGYQASFYHTCQGFQNTIFIINTSFCKVIPHVSSQLKLYSSPLLSVALPSFLFKPPGGILMNAGYPPCSPFGGDGTIMMGRRRCNVLFPMFSSHYMPLHRMPILLKGVQPVRGIGPVLPSSSPARCSLPDAATYIRSPPGR